MCDVYVCVVCDVCDMCVGVCDVCDMCRYAEVLVLVLFGLLVVLWFTREPRFIPGWGSLFLSEEEGDRWDWHTPTYSPPGSSWSHDVILYYCLYVLRKLLTCSMCVIIILSKMCFVAIALFFIKKNFAYAFWLFWLFWDLIASFLDTVHMCL